MQETTSPDIQRCQHMCIDARFSSSYRPARTSIPLGTRSMAQARFSSAEPGQSNSARARRDSAGTPPSACCMHRTASCIACSSRFGGTVEDLRTFWCALMAAPTITSEVATGKVPFTAPDVSCSIISTVHIIVCPERTMTKESGVMQGVGEMLSTHYLMILDQSRVQQADITCAAKPHSTMDHLTHHQNYTSTTDISVLVAVVPAHIHCLYA